MHFFILGGNGRTGLEVVGEAISQGHTITALVRDPSKVAARAGLTLIKGNSTSQDDVRRAMSSGAKVDAVLVTLNAPRASDSPFAKSIAPPRLMADSVQNATTVMKELGVRKIVVMQAFGVETSFHNLNFLMRMTIDYTPMRAQFDDHDAVARELRESARDGSIRFVMVRPAMLKGEEAMPVKLLGDEGEKAGFMPQCSRKSVARFIVQAAETDEFDGRTPVICN